MKRVEEAANMIGQRRMIDVTEDVKLVLKTMDLLKANFGASYLARLLRGDAKFNWSHPYHPELETFGCLMHHHQGWVRCLIYRMVDFGWIEPVMPRCSVLQITPKGKEWLEKPEKTWVAKTELRESQLDIKLRYRLNELRNQIAQTENTSAYAVFTQFTIDWLVKVRPLSYQRLKAIPGIDDQRADRYGAAIVGLIRENEEERTQMLKRNATFRASGPSHQETKQLILEGKTIAEIAAIKKIQETTVIQYIERLHLAEEIDARGMVEKLVDKKTLHKGVAFFKDLTNPKLSEAHKTLKLGYDILRLCKLYSMESRGIRIAG
jgi:ATP-dependent DNA helicase RecQ